MATEETAPMLFQKPDPVPERSSKSKATGKNKAKLDVAKDKTGDKVQVKVQDAPHEGRTDETRQLQVPTEEAIACNVDDGAAFGRMHFESLINFVAFNRKHPQRVFLSQGDPPPPRKSSSSKQAARVKGKEANQPNKEAQMVLHGLLKLETNGSRDVLAGVPKGLCYQLNSSLVEIQSSTYTLMVKACIKVRDLQAASDFLVMIEAAGYVLDSDLLDQVMEAYWLQNKEKDEEGAQKNMPQILPKHLAELAANPTQQSIREVSEKVPQQPPQSLKQPLPMQTSRSNIPSQPWEEEQPQHITNFSEQPQMHYQIDQQYHQVQQIHAPQMQQSMQQQPFQQSHAISNMNMDGSGMMVSPMQQMSHPFDPVSDTQMTHGASGWMPIAVNTAIPSPPLHNATSRQARTTIDPDLPAFSVPEEFASREVVSSNAEGRENESQATDKFSLSPEAAEFTPGGENSKRPRGIVVKNRRLSQEKS
eukprot:TRINITY_DN107105_c0_g1_i1.p1 TRINITY_DN107105_c0_g1~~TRINITY_DN107105_c0_g1_i1.p1  ORF type:complete len:559 (+),score=85.54 TRINITY_DN107105_c0_g1_i1:252-1679(+)